MNRENALMGAKISAMALGLSGILTLAGWGISSAVNHFKEFSKEISVFTEKMPQKILNDLKGNDLYTFDNENVAFAYMSAEHDPSTRSESFWTGVKYSTYHICTYGAIHDAVDKKTGQKYDTTFELKYTFDDNALKDADDLTFVKTINSDLDKYFKVCSIDFGDVSAFTYGLSNEQEAKDFNNVLRQRQPAKKNFDAFVPLYSNAEIVEKEDGNRYAQLTLKSIEGFIKRESNHAAGVVAGTLAYNYASQADNTKSYALPIAIATGYTVAELTSTTSVDSYYVSQTYETVLPEDMSNCSEPQLREYVMSQMANDKNMRPTSYAFTDINEFAHRDILGEAIKNMTPYLEDNLSK